LDAFLESAGLLGCGDPTGLVRPGVLFEVQGWDRNGLPWVAHAPVFPSREGCRSRNNAFSVEDDKTTMPGVACQAKQPRVRLWIPGVSGRLPAATRATASCSQWLAPHTPRVQNRYSGRVCITQSRYLQGRGVGDARHGQTTMPCLRRGGDVGGDFGDAWNGQTTMPCLRRGGEFAATGGLAVQPGRPTQGRTTSRQEIPSATRRWV
jgi:hypothetical protein